MPLPATISGQITDKINALANGQKLSEIEVRGLRKEIEKLKSQSADEYFMLSGMLCSLLNDYDGAKQNHEKALRLSAGDIDLINYGLSLRRLGRHKESLPLMIKACSISPGSAEAMQEALLGMVFAGDFTCFDLITSIFQKANPGYDLTDFHSYGSVIATRSHLKAAEVPEGEYSAVLGIVEEVVFSNECQIHGIGVRLSRFESVPHISVELSVGEVGFEKLYRMNEELADKLSFRDDLTRWDRVIVNLTCREIEDIAA